MDTDLVIGELGVVVVAENHNPSILNPDFLQRNEIVPGDWEPAQPAVSLPPFSQVQFGNGITMVADMARLVVTEDMLSRPLAEAHCLDIVRRYVRTLPHVAYRAVGVNPKGHVQADSPEEAESFISSRLLNSGSWSFFRDSAVQAAVSLRYPLANGNFVLSLEPGALAAEQETETPVLFFSGNFHHDLQEVEQSNLPDQIDAILDETSEDLGAYTALSESIVGGSSAS